MNVLVTGANGFLGLNIVSACVDAGHRVLAWVRESSDARFLQRFPVVIERGALRDVRRLAGALRGVDAVIHCAGDTSCYSRDALRVWEANVDGTRAVVEAARAAGVGRLVYTSTTSTIGAASDPSTRWDEATTLGGFRARSPYGTSKLAAERLVADACEAGLPAVILNPAEVLGPWDHTLQWGRMVLAVAHDRVPFVPPGSASFCSAREVARAHVAALTRGTPGARYILAGADATYADLIAEIAAVVGTSPRRPRGPYLLRRLAARVTLALQPLTGSMPLVDPYRMRVFGGHYLFDPARAVRELGYRAAPLREMVEECWNWYAAEGMVPARAGVAPASDEEAIHA
jgi:dihydroflavonol-4-reductase